MTPCRCAADSASAISVATVSACSSGSGPFASRSRQRLARQVLHHEVGGAVMLADVVQRADVRVVQPGDGLGLALEAGTAVGVGAELGRQDLDGDAAIEAGVAGLVDLAHAARADGGLDLVGPEARAG